jgi:hypothetical protein
MFSLLNPWVIIGAICAVLGVYFYGHHQGYEQRVAEDQAEIIRLNDQAREKEVELNKKLTGVTTALVKARNDVKEKQTSLNARVDLGELRLPSTCNLQTNPSSTPIGGNQAPPSELERKAIKDIVAIVSDGDIAIQSLNACIAQYEQVRQTVNEGVK